MSDYTKITDFSAKDAAEAIIEGADFDAEFDAIATASASKPDKAVPATANSVAGLNSAGNLYDTTVLTADLVSTIANSPATGFMAIWPTNTPPSGWKLCDGTSYSTASEPDLFAVIGYTYGGSGANFTVPDLRGRFPLGQDDMGGTSANRVTATAADNLGQASGSQSHTLTTSEMPSHTHTGTTASGGNHRHSGDYIGSTSTGASGDNKQVKNVSGYTDYAGTHTHTFTTNSSGSGGSHNNMPPYQTVNYIIKA